MQELFNRVAMRLLKSRDILLLLQVAYLFYRNILLRLKYNTRHNTSDAAALNIYQIF
jgi:hypothetical protein